MSSEKRTASALGAKTARACDSCIRRRARWFCAADDAFLCQGCDASVHSANPLARRHDRVRLKMASFKVDGDEVVKAEPAMPLWHRGFQRKARTPRHHAKPKLEPHMNNPLLVPELSADEPSLDENEEQLLYRVPIFDAEFCNSGAVTSTQGVTGGAVEETKPMNLPNYGAGVDNAGCGLLPSDVDLENFAADVESLLGRGLDDVSFCMEGLGGLMGNTTREEEGMECCFGGGRVKVEEGVEEVEGVSVCHMDEELDFSRETLDLNFEYDSPTTGEEEDQEEEKVSVSVPTDEGKRKSTSLRLNYDAVITAWASQGSPWTTGDRPHLNPDDCLPDCLTTCAPDLHTYGDMGFLGGHMTAGDGGREARVSRYREKRRTRLFSKKIRYEVRKLNAEKRPRMKGRFVKRASFAGPAFPF